MLRPTLRMKVRHGSRPISFRDFFLINFLPGVLYWHVGALRVNCARFEPGRSIEPHVTLLLPDDTDTAVTSIGSVE